MNDLFENLSRGGLVLCAWALLILSIPGFGCPFAESNWTIWR